MARRSRISGQRRDPSARRTCLDRAATGITVASSFREGDMAAGGRRASSPMYPSPARQDIYSRPGQAPGIAIHNIGGISNFTYVAPDGSVLAFDTGPEISGSTARPRARPGTSSRWTSAESSRPKAPPISAPSPRRSRILTSAKLPPKSTGRDDFRIEQILKLTKTRGADLVATATEATAASIAEAYQDFVIDSGPAALVGLRLWRRREEPHPPFRIGFHLPDVKVTSLAEAGFDPTWIEAQGFAYFGFLSLIGSPVGGNWTGASGFAPPGRITPGRELAAAFDEASWRLGGKRNPKTVERDAAARGVRGHFAVNHALRVRRHEARAPLEDGDQ